LILLSFSVVAGGLLFWWGLERLFWRKYFTPRNLPEPLPKLQEAEEDQEGKTGRA
jgi:hypothetical protein